MTAYLPKEKPQIRTLVVNNGVINTSEWHPYDVIEQSGGIPGPFVCDYIKNPLNAIPAELTKDVTGRCEDAIEYFQEVLNGVRFRYIELDPSRESTRKRFPWVNPFWDTIRVNTSFGYQTVDDDGVYVTLGARFTDFDHHSIRYTDSLEYFTNWTKNHDVVRQSILLLGPVEILSDIENFVERNGGHVFNSFWYGRTGVFDNAVLYLTMEFGTLKNCRAKFRRLAAHGGEYTITGADRQFGTTDTLKLFNTPNETYLMSRNDIHWVKTARLRWPYYYESLVDICLAMAEFDLPVYVILEIVDWLPKMELTNRRKRVRVIERMKASIKRVYANRDLTKISNKRTKK